MLPTIDKRFTKNTGYIKNSDLEFEYVMKFDGCSKGNPGLAGAGAVIYHFDKEYWSESLFVGEFVTNNYAEYSGLILGLQQAIKLGIKHLKIEGDSLLVINQMKGVYNCNSINLIQLHESARELESNFETLQYEHIFRNKNKRADELSNHAVETYIHFLHK